MSSNSARSALHAAAEASGLTVLVPAEEMGQYQLHMSRISVDLRPETQTECELVQRIANAEWRLQQVARLELAVFAAGRLEFADLYPEQQPEIRVLLIERRTFQVYARELKQLNLQEARLRRYLLADKREYLALHNSRLQAQSEPACQPEPLQPQPEQPRVATAVQGAMPEVGFVFSNRASATISPAELPKAAAVASGTSRANTPSRAGYSNLGVTPRL